MLARLIVIGLLLTGIPFMNAQAEEARAVFAGGCFWCMEAELQTLDGVKDVISGYTGGEMKNPTYKDVGTGKTGHAEAVEVVYDPSRISYSRLLDAYWDNIDPTDPGGQFFDRGTQYRTVIYYMNDEQKKLAEMSLAERQKRLVNAIVTTIEPAGEFYPAEEYHQDYYKTNESHYNAYKKGSRREDTLRKVWGEK